jgi:hypothetical protein
LMNDYKQTRQPQWGQAVVAVFHLVFGLFLHKFKVPATNDKF